MNLKDLLMPAMLAIFVMWGLQYFMPNRFKRGPQGAQVTSGQSFVAPESRETSKPLNLEVDFIDTKRSAPPEFTEVETDGATLQFSSDGASLDRITFKHEVDGIIKPITTVFPVNPDERELRCFLVALDEKTPYYYKLVDRRESNGTTELTYKGTFGDGTVFKKFTIYQDVYKIDLEVQVVPRAGLDRKIEPRILFISPFMPNIARYDVFSGIAANEKGKLKTTVASSLKPRQGWHQPTLFGTGSRYFVHAMISDKDNFVQRAYYKKTDSHRIISFLEGPEVSQEDSWQLSFYFGPKEEEALAVVDPRLSQTLGYAGMLAPISKFLFFLLKFFYKYLKNYGLAIILLTVLMRLVLLPFTLKQGASAKKQEEFTKKTKYIEQRYKGDSERIGREKLALIRKHGIPAFNIGCVVQMILMGPIFIALRYVLSSAIELYQAPLGLWIQDLSQPDPYYIFPALIVIGMVLNAFSVPASQRTSLILMGIFFGSIMINFSAGLTLYFAVSTILGSLQTLIQKKLQKNGGKNNGGRYVG